MKSVQQFRDAVAASLEVSDAVLGNLIDVLAVGPRPASPVELTLSSLWGYDWNTLYAGIHRAGKELAENITDDDWLPRLRQARLSWLESQASASPPPETGDWRVRILDASDYPRPKTETVEFGYVHGAEGMRLGHGLSLLSERVGEGSWTLPKARYYLPGFNRSPPLGHRLRSRLAHLHAPCTAPEMWCAPERVTTVHLSFQSVLPRKRYRN